MVSVRKYLNESSASMMATALERAMKKDGLKFKKKKTFGPTGPSYEVTSASGKKAVIGVGKVFHDHYTLYFNQEEIESDKRVNYILDELNKL